MTRSLFVLITFFGLLIMPITAKAEEMKNSVDSSALAPASMAPASLQTIRSEMDEFQQALENEFRKAKAQYVMNQELEKPPVLNLAENTEE